jgi:hypothetical protein
MNHGRKGKHPKPNLDEVKSCAALCNAFAGRGYVVLMLVRRGYGNFQSPDCKLKETATQSLPCRIYSATMCWSFLKRLGWLRQPLNPFPVFPQHAAARGFLQSSVIVADGRQ